MGSPPEPRLVLLILGLCCAPVICQHLKIGKDLQKEKNFLFYSSGLKYVRKVLAFCKGMSLDCSMLVKKRDTPWNNRNGYYLMDTYLKFAEREGNPETMTGKEFTEYLKVDIPDYIEEIVKKEMTSLDEDKDGELNMEEYFTFLHYYMTKKFGPMTNKGQ